MSFLKEMEDSVATATADQAAHTAEQNCVTADELLSVGDYYLIRALFRICEKNDRSLLHDACVLWSFSQPEATHLRFLMALINDEINSTVSATTLFRSNTNAARLVSVSVKLKGYRWLVATMTDWIQEMTQNPVELDVDPAKAIPGADLEANRLRLEERIRKILLLIAEHRNKCPWFINQLAAHLHDRVSLKFWDFYNRDTLAHPYSALGGMLHLRFLCPSVFAPLSMGLIDEKPTPDANKNLLLVSKVLQMMANGLYYKTNPGESSTMSCLNPFMRESMPLMYDFLESFVKMEGSTDALPSMEDLRRSRSSSVEAKPEFSNTSADASPPVVAAPVSVLPPLAMPGGGPSAASLPPLAMPSSSSSQTTAAPGPTAQTVLSAHVGGIAASGPAAAAFPSRQETAPLVMGATPLPSLKMPAPSGSLSPSRSALEPVLPPLGPPEGSAPLPALQYPTAPLASQSTPVAPPPFTLPSLAVPGTGAVSGTAPTTGQAETTPEQAAPTSPVPTVSGVAEGVPFSKESPAAAGGNDGVCAGEEVSSSPSDVSLFEVAAPCENESGVAPPVAEEAPTQVEGEVSGPGGETEAEIATLRGGDHAGVEDSPPPDSAAVETNPKLKWFVDSLHQEYQAGHLAEEEYTKRKSALVRRVTRIAPEAASKLAGKEMLAPGCSTADVQPSVEPPASKESHVTVSSPLDDILSSTVVSPSFPPKPASPKSSALLENPEVNALLQLLVFDHVHREASRIVKPVFGGNLEALAQPEETHVPLCVQTCVRWLEANDALRETGLFRLAGSTNSKTILKKSANERGFLELKQHGGAFTPHLVGDLLKGFLRELEEPVLIHRFYSTYVKVAKNDDRKKRLLFLRKLVNGMPLPNKCTILYLLNFFHRVALRHKMNKMGPENLATVLAPNLLWDSTLDPMKFMEDSPLINKVVQNMIEEASFMAGDRDELAYEDDAIEEFASLSLEECQAEYADMQGDAGRKLKAKMRADSGSRGRLLARNAGLKSVHAFDETDPDLKILHKAEELFLGPHQIPGEPLETMIYIMYSHVDDVVHEEVGDGQTAAKASAVAAMSAFFAVNGCPPPPPEKRAAPKAPHGMPKSPPATKKKGRRTESKIQSRREDKEKKREEKEKKKEKEREDKEKERLAKERELQERANATIEREQKVRVLRNRVQTLEDENANMQKLIVNLTMALDSAERTMVGQTGPTKESAISFEL